MSIQTVLFDLDGTILDTNELIIVSFIHTFKQYDLSFTKEEILEFNGPPLKDTFQKINPSLADAMVETYRKHNLLHHNKYARVFPGVMETLERLMEHDIQLGIVTAKMRKGVMLGLEQTGLNRFFDTIITIDDVTHPKPHPEPVMMAMHQLNGQAGSTLMVGDNSHDIKSGQSAGVRTAGVAWSEKGRDFLASYNPTYMLEEMKDLLPIVGV